MTKITADVVRRVQSGTWTVLATVTAYKTNNPYEKDSYLLAYKYNNVWWIAEPRSGMLASSHNWKTRREAIAKIPEILPPKRKKTYFKSLSLVPSIEQRKLAQLYKGD